ncbi:MAG: HD domain-containing protein [Dehalococcoidia bacterium]|nr:HD domain-containing protein [Dehalococcoidia bacterium]
MGVTREQFIEAFRSSGHELWLVGGALRDRLLGLDSKDLDYSTDADPDAIEAVAGVLGAPVTTVGKRFGTIGVLVDGEWSELTTFRGDTYRGGSRWPDVTFGSSIEEDLARRDFTINAFAEDAFTGRKLDLYGGEADLRAGIIRAVGEPERRFREDPLRILRGIRFASQLGFAIEPGTLAGMEATAGLIATLSQERVTTELDKLLRGKAPRAGLESLRTTGALSFALPELVPMIGCEQNRFHRFDVWGHTVATVDAIATTPETLRVRRWSALLHDLGKPAVRHVKANGEWGFYRHETAGAELAGTLLERLKMARQDLHAITLLVRRHMDRPDPGESRSVRRYMAKSPGHWRDLLALKRADNASHTYDDAEYHDLLESACERIESEEADRLKAESPLTGDDLVAMFDREPGPWIRVVKERLSAMVLDGELAPGDRPAAERVARKLMGR